MMLCWRICNPTIPDWELLQAGEHAFLMAESAGLVLSPHTVDLFNKWTNNWIHAPLPSVASNRESKGPKIHMDYNDSSWILPHPRLKVGPLLQVFGIMFTPPALLVLFVLSLKENAAAEQGTWWRVSLQNRADGTKPCVHFAQWGKGCLAQWWPLVLLTIWYFPTTKGPLQLWKIFSLTSTLTINNFFIVFSHHGVLLLLGCFTERAVCQALTCLAQGGITVQLISSAWSSFLWSYLQTVTWW